jgi:predicted short-subunit dehydrogenase-like oxidoreductase (DUF2520 family)
MGQGIAIALAGTGCRVTLLARSPRPAPEPLAVVTPPWSAAIRAASLLVIATPDDAIEAAAHAIAGLEAVGGDHVVLHLSGLLDRRVLAPLSPSQAALGSFHPLQTVSDPRSAPERLVGAFAAVEGDPRAVKAAESVADRLGMHAVRVNATTKPLYHAAAVIAGNAPAVLADVAARLARSAGIAPELAARMYLPLIAGAVENLREATPAAALTGPARRGDLATLRTHLAALPPDVAPLYRVLGLEAVRLASHAGLDEASVAAVRALLQEHPVTGGEP